MASQEILEQLARSIPPQIGQFKGPRSTKICNGCGEKGAREVFQIGLLEDGRVISAVCHNSICAGSLMMELKKVKELGIPESDNIYGDFFIAPKECAFNYQDQTKQEELCQPQETKL